MEIDGNYTLQASPEEVWNSLKDPRTLLTTTPGIERLEKIGDHTYAFTLHIKHAQLRGTYSGLARVIEQSNPCSYRFTIEGEGQHSKMHGECSIQINTLSENTVVAYKGSIQQVKLSTLLPVPMVKGTIKALFQQFFTSLAEQLRSNRAYVDTIVDAGETEGGAGTPSPGRRPQLIASREGNPSTPFLHMLVRQVGLGKGDPLLEERWVTRLRRISMISVLLLLVWIGTRLPRRLFAQD